MNQHDTILKEEIYIENSYARHWWQKNTLKKFKCINWSNEVPRATLTVFADHLKKLLSACIIVNFSLFDSMENRVSWFLRLPLIILFVLGHVLSIYVDKTKCANRYWGQSLTLNQDSNLKSDCAAVSNVCLLLLPVRLRGGKSVWDQRPPTSFWSDVGVTGAASSPNYGSLGQVTCGWLAPMSACVSELLNDDANWRFEREDGIEISMDDSPDSFQYTSSNKTAAHAEDAEARRWKETHRMSAEEYCNDMRNCLRWVPIHLTQLDRNKTVTHTSSSAREPSRPHQQHTSARRPHNPRSHAHICILPPKPGPTGRTVDSAVSDPAGPFYRPAPAPEAHRLARALSQMMTGERPQDYALRSLQRGTGEGRGTCMCVCVCVCVCLFACVRARV
jgi:hypothetical protein